MELIKYTKIALKPKGDVTLVVLHYTEPTEAGGTQDHLVESKDAPMDSFVKAMRALDNFVGLLCEFPIAYAEGCKVHTVSMSTVHEKTAVILSVRKDLPSVGKAFNFNTPRFQEADEESDATIPADLLQAVNELAQEANKYRMGERSQVAMDLGDTVAGDGPTPPAADSEDGEWEGEDELPPVAERNPDDIGAPDLPDED